MKHFVFVYGTLKRGFHNDRYLRGAKFVEALKIKGISIHLDDETGLPFAMKKPGSSANGEIYEVDDRTLAILDKLEDHPHWYKREAFKIKGMRVWIYLNPHEARNLKVIPFGNFTQQAITERMLSFREYRPTIVMATSRNLNSIARLESAQEYQKWSKGDLSNAIQNPTYETRVMFAESVVGYYVSKQVPNGSILNKIVVNESARGKGYGRLLIQDWIKRAQSRNERHLTLQVEAGNTSAQSLYQKMGFETTNVLEGYYENGNNAFEMSRIL